MIEKEQKFLFTAEIFPEGFERTLILQGYFAKDKGNQCRVRIQRFKDCFKSFLTLKKDIDSGLIERKEYEIEIDNDLAFEIMQDCQCMMIKERRFKDNISIDNYIQHSFLKIVEIEFKDVMEPIPDYCGKNVSKKCKNINYIVAKGMKKLYTNDFMIQYYKNISKWRV